MPLPSGRARRHAPVGRMMTLATYTGTIPAQHSSKELMNTAYDRRLAQTTEARVERRPLADTWNALAYVRIREGVLVKDLPSRRIWFSCGIMWL
jgi:hypothetical protein